MVLLTGVKTDYTYELDGTCELCFGVSSNEVKYFIFEDESGAEYKMQNGQYSYGSYLTHFSVNNIFLFMDFFNGKEVEDYTDFATTLYDIVDEYNEYQSLFRMHDLIREYELFQKVPNLEKHMQSLSAQTPMNHRINIESYASSLSYDGNHLGVDFTDMDIDEIIEAVDDVYEEKLKEFSRITKRGYSNIYDRVII